MAGDTRVALITGAAGFAGRHLVRELERETPWDVVGLARHAMSLGERTRVLACDLREADLVRRVLDRVRPDIIFHLAAQSYVPKAFASPADTLVSNLTGQLNLLEASRSIGIDPVVLIIGSAEEYGSVPADQLPVTEATPFRPANPYAVSKVGQDMLGLQYHLAFGMRVIRARPFNHFGPGQDDRFVVSNFARQIAQIELGRVEPVVLTGNLDAKRDFLDVRDVVRAYRLLVVSGVAGEVYNVARGAAISIGDILSSLIASASLAIEVRQDPTRLRPSDTPVLYGDASRLRQATGWAATYELDRSLLDTLNYWRELLPGYEERSDVERA